MSEPLRWEEREIEIKPERVERTATYEEILKDFDNPCLVRALVERCQALEARIRVAEGLLKEAEAELHEPVEVTVKLDTAAIVEAVLAGLKTLPGFHHGHTWHEYDGAYYCYGCKTFMPNKAARAAFEAEGQ